MKSRIFPLFAGLIAAFILGTTQADAGQPSQKVGDLEITDTWARATPPNAKTGGGYMTIVNHGMTGDKLLGATSDVAKKTELHNHIMEGGVMRMRQVPFIAIPMHGKAVFKPGGLHVMFMGLTEGLKAGGMVMVKLRFEKAGEVMVHLPIKKTGGSSMKKMDHKKKHSH